MSRPTITIDGPAGAGKSTIARMVAKRLGYRYIDTGALYRALGWKVCKEKVNPQDRKKLKELLRETRIVLKNRSGLLRVYVSGKDVTNRIRAKGIDEIASKLATIPWVRDHLNRLQRNMARGGGVIIEGRDAGTVVFPRAEYKFFLDASLQERVQRKYRELKRKGKKIQLDELEKAIRLRDTRDRSRKVAPLKIAPDAFYIDSTNMTKKEVTDFVISKIKVSL